MLEHFNAEQSTTAYMTILRAATDHVSPQLAGCNVLLRDAARAKRNIKK